MGNDSEIKGVIEPIIRPTYDPTQQQTVGSSTFIANPVHVAPVEIPTYANENDMSSEIQELVRIKQGEYANKAILFKRLHLFLLIAGASLGIITPLLIPNFSVIAQITSIAVVIIISIDQIFKPKDKYTLYSKASDLIQLQKFKKAGVYESNKDLVDTIINTEMDLLNTVPELTEVLNKVNDNDSSS